MRAIRYSPRRLTFRFSLKSVFEVSRLRGVWGRALHELDESLYRRAFDGEPDASSGSRRALSPRYLIRPSLDVAPKRDLTGFVAGLDFFFWNVSADESTKLLDAWRAAGEAGLGRERAPFRVLRVDSLVDPNAFDVSVVDASRKLAPDAPVLLRALAPLRIVRAEDRGSRAVVEPTAEDFVRAAFSRLSLMLPPCETSRRLFGMKDEALELARTLDYAPRDWQSVGVRRYSGRQKREIDLDGSMGATFFPKGLGALTPLFTAVEAVHLGKSTTLGLGRIALETTNAAEQDAANASAD